MICPQCGLNIESPDASQCPRCGQPLRAAAGAPDAPVPSPAPGAPQAAGGAATPLSPLYAPPPPPPTPPGGQPGGYPAYPPPYGTGYGPPVQPGPPAYGPGYYGPPVPPGYPPLWAPPGAFSPPPAPPRRRVSAPLIAGITVLVLILLAALAAGSTYIAGQRTAPQAATTPTVPSTPTPVMPGMSGRTLLIDDSLLGEAPEWPRVSNCNDSSDGYHITDSYFCYPGDSDVTNATISVQAELYSGSPDLVYGIAFRILNQANRFAYYFVGVSSVGYWTFGRNDNGTWTSIVDPRPSSAIPTGAQTFATLTVNATGSHFDFYVGRTQIGSADDSKLTDGYSGLSVSGTGEAVFTNFMIAN